LESKFTQNQTIKIIKRVNSQKIKNSLVHRAFPFSNKEYLQNSTIWNKSYKRSFSDKSSTITSKFCVLIFIVCIVFFYVADSPIIKMKPNNITVNETDDFLIFCDYEANPATLLKVTW